MKAKVKSNGTKAKVAEKSKRVGLRERGANAKKMKEVDSDEGEEDMD